MTIQELIDNLNTYEDKSLEVVINSPAKPILDIGIYNFSVNFEKSKMLLLVNDFDYLPF